MIYLMIILPLTPAEHLGVFNCALTTGLYGVLLLSLTNLGGLYARSSDVSTSLPPVLPARRRHPPVQPSLRGYSGRHSPLNRACTRPNLVAVDADGAGSFLGPRFRHGTDLKQLEDGLTSIRCGHCLNCRIRRASGWKLRGLHEMQSSFHPTLAVTLTYDQDHLPPNGSLSVRDLQLFLKRLRKATKPFRYLACGEYGPTTGRAHYHAVLFGVQLPDLYHGAHWGSQTILEAWGNGQVSLHPATPASIGYVSGYVVKKLRAPRGQGFVMETVDPDTGLVVSEDSVEPEFLTASRRPGLGRAWIDQFAPEVIRDGFIVNEREKPIHAIPEYYDKVLKSEWWDHPGFADFLDRRFASFDQADELDEEGLLRLEHNVEAELSKIMRSGV